MHVRGEIFQERADTADLEVILQILLHKLLISLFLYGVLFQIQIGLECIHTFSLVTAANEGCDGAVLCLLVRLVVVPSLFSKILLCVVFVHSH